MVLMVGFDLSHLGGVILSLSNEVGLEKEKSSSRDTPESGVSHLWKLAHHSNPTLTGMVSSIWLRREGRTFWAG
ncbi:hypothetical protein COT69_00425 [candidate division WWE3 bacterium CG09_land_8_20_14_0_10_39_24]|uniref:Uncharacterized protein n=1 Tax=candidate division WWE3 bacterium CG09_land_8_20_14_0_10_39_24 TaxID=1975088 RepID=A0A2H0WKB6_UNCKA|nr:MAG: hypothetical protein AUJ94_02650 [bacterium CG2_30_40_12]OJI09498.1 MAG: hypothetical protein BK003_00415 [bacterium CG09_39_24]PIS13112.1 MAG: hypothetical protein COT69_00425 [candidate division WWE3 bacterium CG09_land_8_20_14_0_10_39_24]